LTLAYRIRKERASLLIYFVRVLSSSLLHCYGAVKYNSSLTTHNIHAAPNTIRQPTSIHLKSKYTHHQILFPISLTLFTRRPTTFFIHQFNLHPGTTTKPHYNNTPSLLSRNTIYNSIILLQDKIRSAVKNEIRGSLHFFNTPRVRIHYLLTRTTE
jgi:hypothetical protein